MAKPVLYVFAISHYCEKARWALEYLGIPFTLKPIAPGIHMKTAKKLGLKTGSLPFLQTDSETIQGSAAIIDWAERQATKQSNNEKKLTPVADEASVREIENRLDDIAGVHVRRYYYSEALVEHPLTVRPLFTSGIPLLHNLVIRSKWKMITELMIKRMDLGTEQGVQSRSIIDKEIAWLDDYLEDGRDYLVGNQLSRADIAAASLFAPLVSPANHPVYSGLVLPPRMTREIAEWENRPTFKWVQKLYANHR